MAIACLAGDSDSIISLALDWIAKTRSVQRRSTWDIKTGLLKTSLWSLFHVAISARQR